ncbi:MAG TPA: hydrogenase formation protein HypD, partial [bacterium]|nr:hydrogenase formation protein HypD [bacterium]
VRYEGNKEAVSAISEAFVPSDSNWRGIGVIPASGLVFSAAYDGFDAAKQFNPDVSYSKEPAGCRCGDVLKGAIKPPECPLFGRKCALEDPVGACMVSAEGSCAAYYKYERK